MQPEKSPKQNYANWQRGLSEAAERIAEEQSKDLANFDHAANWKLIDDLIRMGLKHQPPMRTTSGLVQYRQVLDAMARKKESGGTKQ